LEADQDTSESPFVPDIWVWANWYGQAKTYNDTIGVQTIPNIPGWHCEAFHPGHVHENVVWFQLPSVTTSRTAWRYINQPPWWTQVDWEHYYASERGWIPYGSNNYFLMVPDTWVCMGYNPPENWFRIYGQYWD